MSKELNQFVGNVINIIHIFDFSKPKKINPFWANRKGKWTKPNYDINALK